MLQKFTGVAALQKPKMRAEITYRDEHFDVAYDDIVKVFIAESEGLGYPVSISSSSFQGLLAEIRATVESAAPDLRPSRDSDPFRSSPDDWVPRRKVI